MFPNGAYRKIAIAMHKNYFLKVAHTGQFCICKILQTGYMIYWYFYLRQLRQFRGIHLRYSIVKFRWFTSGLGGWRLWFNNSRIVQTTIVTSRTKKGNLDFGTWDNEKIFQLCNQTTYVASDLFYVFLFVCSSFGIIEWFLIQSSDFFHLIWYSVSVVNAVPHL